MSEMRERGRGPASAAGVGLLLSGVLASGACATPGAASLVADGVSEIRHSVERLRMQQTQIHSTLEAITASPRSGELPILTVQEKISAPPGHALASPAVQPAEAELLYRQGYALFHRGDYAGAEQALRSYLVALPQSPHADQALFWLGESLLAAGNQNEATQVFQALLTRFPASERAPHARARIAASRTSRP